MFIIGITGTTGSGKTAALRALENLGALALDCDEIYHSLLSDNESMITEIATRFKGTMKDESINREILGKIVFNDPSALLDLNEITHKYVIDEIKNRLSQWEAQGGKYAGIDAIALIESGISKMCDVVVGITAPVEARASRIMTRDGITQEQAEKRINAQKPDSFFKENCDYMLESVYETIEEFKEKCLEFFTNIITCSPSR